MSRFGVLQPALLAAAAVLATSTVGVRAEDDYMAKAKAFVAKVTAPGAPWNGQRPGPRRRGTSW